MPANVTKRNHFVPCFYSSRWTNDDGKLCEFSRPYKAVTPRRTAPKGTGWSEDLYTEASLPPGVRTYLEDTFLKLVDQRASDAITLLEDRKLNDMTEVQKNAWVRFIMSMLNRSPQKIAALKQKWISEYATVRDPDIEARYQAQRKPGDPDTVVEYLKDTPPATIGRGSVRLLQSVMDLPNLGAHIRGMAWATIDVNSRFPLLTSDRPVIMTNGLLHANGHLGLPIGPRTLFIAANKEEMIRTIVKIPGDELARNTNTIVIEQAETLVLGRTDKALAFVEKHLRPHAPE